MAKQLCLCVEERCFLLFILGTMRDSASFAYYFLKGAFMESINASHFGFSGSTNNERTLSPASIPPALVIVML